MEFSPKLFSSPRAVIWDLDGTLVDSSLLHWQAWREELALLGRDLAWEEFAAMFGQRNDTTLRTWLRPDLTDEEIYQIGEAKERRFRRTIDGVGLPLLPGAQALLEGLRDTGWRQALATMAGRENVQAMLGEPQRRHFDVIVAAEDVVNGKPAPDVFLKAAERLGVPPARCIVVEDSPAGILAAKRAGMLSVGVGEFAREAQWSFDSLLQIAPGNFNQLVPAG